MARFVITIKTDNAAFEGDNWGTEVARILRELADNVDDGPAPMDGPMHSIRDINGNRVGTATLEI